MESESVFSFAIASQPFPIVQLTDIEIKDDIGIKNGILRKRFIRELKELKKTADYTSCDGGLTANFLSR